jgi:hypothetical protein
LCNCSNGFAFGENSQGTANPFIGTGDFALSNTTTNTRSDSSWYLFFFHWAFSAAAATIVAGAVAERIAFECYMGYTCIMTSFVSTASSELRAYAMTCVAVGVCQSAFMMCWHASATAMVRLLHPCSQGS